MGDPLFFFSCFAGFILGMCAGSFASALVWRIPRRLPWVYEVDEKGAFKEFVRSNCPSCRHELGARDLMPVLSWVFQGGKCRYCQNHIGKIYPLLEIMAGIFGAIIFIIFGLSFQAILALFFFIFLFVFTWTYLQQKFFSAQILLILMFLGIVFIVFTGF